MEKISDGLRRRKLVAKVFKELDAFPKVPESYQETSTSGGTVSIVVFICIGILVISEFIYYQGSIFKYMYEVDKDADSKIRINIDMTVAMECDHIGADVLDVSGTSVDTESNLKLTPAYFSMSSVQLEWWNLFRKFREKHSDEYRSVNEVAEMYSVFGSALPTYMPPKNESEFDGKDKNACRIFGNLVVNKVAGNFHITAGKSIPHPRGHAHLSSLVSELDYNFSHRIDLLSFGDSHPGIINPLDGDLMTTENSYHIYQYYIKIVPTTINTSKKRNFKTNQYSVTQRSRKIDHSTGSHGVPGIFFKYDLHAIGVKVTEEKRELSQFLVRMCGIIGGIFATSGMLHGLVGFMTDCILNHMNKRSQRRATSVSLVNKMPSNTVDNQVSEPPVALVSPPAVTIAGTANVLADPVSIAPIQLADSVILPPGDS